MTIEIHAKINYVLEEKALLESIVRPDGHPVRLLECMNNIEKNIRSEALNHRFSVVNGILKAGAKALKKDMPAVNEYFKCFSNYDLCLADAVLLLGPWDQLEHASEVPAYISHFDSQERCRRFLSILETFNPDLSQNEPKNKFTLERVSHYLDQTMLLPEEKWQLLSVFINWESHPKPLLGLLEKAETVLDQTKPDWQPLITDFYRYWNRQIAQRDVIMDIKETFHIDLFAHEEQMPVHIAPLLLRMNTISFSLSNGLCEAAGYDLYYIGILYGEDIYLDFAVPKDRDTQMHNALSLLKLLSDKSKLEILLSIKKSPAYGAELARKMNLTTATISYHINAMVQEHLIELERINNRIYYSIHPETLQNLLDYIKKELL